MNDDWIVYVWRKSFSLHRERAPLPDRATHHRRSELSKTVSANGFDKNRTEAEWREAAREHGEENSEEEEEELRGDQQRNVVRVMNTSIDVQM